MSEFSAPGPRHLKPNPGMPELKIEDYYKKFLENIKCFVNLLDLLYVT
ncbi:hypothetical protein D1AOALGA4SA_6159 [Olavius algarvensis Delta 1 endosymbiont]|nr:hypothetical protein D1AOALGA4SA_6159 [Olavius algarvensis Delta 1 endosymbiont]